MKGFATSTKKIRNRGKKLTSTIIKFRLSHASVLVFVFRGPGPNCKVAARITAVGLAGINRFRFHGYIGKRPLAPGTYELVMRPKGTSTTLARTHLSIVNPGAPRARQVRPECQDDNPVDLTEVLAAAPLLGSLVGEFAVPATPSVTARNAESKPEPKATGGTLGEKVEESAPLPPLPGIGGSAEDSTGWINLLIAPALLALLFGALAFAAARRRSKPRW